MKTQKSENTKQDPSFKTNNIFCDIYENPDSTDQINEDDTTDSVWYTEDFCINIYYE